MPWKLISFIICIVIVTVFVGFNIENKCNISFGFFQLENVPIFFSLLVAFIVGVLVVLPFTFINSKKKTKKVPQETKDSVPVKDGKKNLFAKKDEKKAEQTPVIKTENKQEELPTK